MFFTMETSTTSSYSALSLEVPFTIMVCQSFYFLKKIIDFFIYVSLSPFLSLSSYVFMRSLSVQSSGSLFLVPSLGLFTFFLLCLSHSDVLVFALTYLILLSSTRRLFIF